MKTKLAIIMLLLALAWSTLTMMDLERENDLLRESITLQNQIISNYAEIERESVEIVEMGKYIIDNFKSDNEEIQAKLKVVADWIESEE